MRYLLILLALCWTARGANPSFGDFAPAQFGTNANKVFIKNGAAVTNFNVVDDVLWVKSPAEFRLTGGEGVGKILISDANGVAAWSTNIPGNIVVSNLITTNLTVVNNLTTSNLFYVSGHGNTLVVTQQLVLNALATNHLLRINNTGNIVTNSGMSDDGSSVISIPNSYTQFKIPDGSAVAPGLTFTAGGNDGLARISTATLSLVSQGTEIARIADGSAGSFDGFSLPGTHGFKMANGAGSGKVLTSDANGVGTWTASSGDTTATNIVTLTQTGTNAAQLDFSLVARGGVWKLALTNNAYFGAPANVNNTDFKKAWLIVQQPSTGTCLVTWTNGFFAGPEGQALINDTNNGAVVIYELISDVFTNGLVHVFMSTKSKLMP